jgi:hypothetical protein
MAVMEGIVFRHDSYHAREVHSDSSSSMSSVTGNIVPSFENNKKLGGRIS